MYMLLHLYVLRLKVTTKPSLPKKGDDSPCVLWPLTLKSTERHEHYMYLNSTCDIGLSDQLHMG